jgi:hypothetical protein
VDAVGLQTLSSELRADAEVAVAAIDLAGERFAEGSDAGHDSAGHHLSRAYNVIEQMALRVAKAFENHVDDERGWHTELIRRMSIRIEGVRPPLFPDDLRPALQELRGFRHVFVHAYDLTLDPEKLALILKYARAVRDRLSAIVTTFVTAVADEQGIGPLSSSP